MFPALFINIKPSHSNFNCYYIVETTNSDVNIKLFIKKYIEFYNSQRPHQGVNYIPISKPLESNLIHIN